MIMEGQMNLLNNFFNLFKKQISSSEDDKIGKLWIEGQKTFERGKELWSARHFQDALDSFDLAIESGFEGYDIYALRASCLRGLGFDLDAIDDFCKAISLASEEANLYFMRSLSRETTGDFAGCISDLQEAIRLSKIDNKYNAFWNNYSKESGWTSATALYEHYLSNAQLNRKFYEKNPEAWQRQLERHPAHWRRSRKPSDYKG
jgi:tetratricopeptide (TPR) repeat protein